MEGRAMKETDLNKETAQPRCEPTLFSTFISAVASGDLSAAEALVADDVEWDMMPTGQVLKGKAEVMSRWARAEEAASHKPPVTISDLAAKDWGTFEFWNIGVLTEALVAFGNEQKWPWPKDPNSLIGQEYKVADCYVWHLNAEGKIYLMRQYVDTGSFWSQFT
jgi:ketosteroid isomerase-like protein